MVGRQVPRVHFRMSRNGESLKRPVRQHAPQLDVATALGVHRESELIEEANDLHAGEAPGPRHPAAVAAGNQVTPAQSIVPKCHQ